MAGEPDTSLAHNPLTTSPMYVALIQTACALPFFVLALPAGSIGDIFDRRKLILRTELWMLGIAIVLEMILPNLDAMKPDRRPICGRKLGLI